MLQCTNCPYLFRYRPVKYLYFVLFSFTCYIILSPRLSSFVKIFEPKVKIKEEIYTTITSMVNRNTLREMKYILLWTNPRDTPIVYLGSGQQTFLSKKCEWTNCYVTSDRTYLGHYSEFEVIIFNGPRLGQIISLSDFPLRRSTRQKYVYANIEASPNYPVHNNIWNGYFNWTWTYKLDSDSLWGYLAIRNASYHVIGPRLVMHWLNIYEMDQVDEELIRSLGTKTKAAAWFSSNCDTLSNREALVRQIQEGLRYYGLQLDIYGTCGALDCPREIMNKCLKFLEKHYYFYFAFENALSEDYVTEKVVYALNSNTVPVVYGGANYSRFMPDGIYLDASKLRPKELARKMNEIIQSPRLYQSFFRWKKHYSYHFRHESPETDDYCNFCAQLNDELAMKTTTVYNCFDSWWKSNITQGYPE